MFNECGNTPILSRTPTHLYLMPHPLLRGYVAHYTLMQIGSGGQADATSTQVGGTQADATSTQVGDGQADATSAQVGDGQTDATPTQGTLTLIPDASGCIVLERGGRGLDGVLWGATTRSVVVENDIETTSRFFIEFLPAGGFVFTGIPQNELTDRRFQLSDIDSSLVRELDAAYNCSLGLADFIERVDMALLRRLEASPLAPAVNIVMSRLRREAGIKSVEEAAAETFYSRRHLNRMFSEQVGMSVKALARMIRANNAVRQMRDGAKSLTALAHELGYYDQPHFIRDFSEICGVTPTEYLAGLSDFYNETLKFDSKMEDTI